ncbi:DEAD/DEAH box helicase family protein [Lactiplantibacillus fabifermentans]|uniref:DEAD/DEAH box helicase family protein n=1 Tax=Lactiplantibacillus fabifermentans TaxID=483011 RepID=UPI0004B4FD2C|nr:DEAD/DEAH box helicase family protein [Lactiplantibacillus fabifermentans]
MADKTKIKTTKVVYPQIYAYTLPQIAEDAGWIKIGYTEREDVDTRIHEQTHTAAIRLTANKLWSEPAKYSVGDGWFTDKKLHKYLTSQKNVKQRLNTEWFYYDGTPERAHEDFEDFRDRKYEQSKGISEYTLRDEQEAAVKRTVTYAKDHIGGEFLWNAKPRFGKTLTTYDFARKLNAETVLVVTNRPAIANSWFDDFEKFIAWQTDYAFVSTTDSLKERPTMSREEFRNQLDGGKQRMVAFISLQDIKGAIPFGGAVDKLKWVKDLHWDLLVIDESHEGADTLKADVAFDNINRDFTLNLSGTPFKAVAKGTFSDDQIFNWTYADEQTAKENWPANDEEHNPYRKLPRLNLFSYQMSRMITNEVDAGAQIDGKDADYAFDLNEFFLTNNSGKFIHEDDVRKWLRTLWENNGYPFSNDELRNELKHTFWILNRVASAKALEKLIKDMDVFDGYKVVIAAGDGRTDDDQVQNMRSLDKVRKAIAEYERTITLSVGQLTTGVTVPQWTGVLMLSNIKSPSLYMQAAFRSQNPWTYTENGIQKEKVNAYVFDFAPERTLTIYDDFANNLSSETTNGGGTTEKRKDNLKTLLNFFPVIAEDTEGKMVQLDVNQVLTIPKSIKAKEVVKRGFMSNLLFQNIGGIFASNEAREILEQMPAVPEGKTVPEQKAGPVDTHDVQVDDQGEVVVESDAVEAVVEHHFGEKIYAEVGSTVEDIDVEGDSRIAKNIADAFRTQTFDSMKNIAKDSGLNTKAAETATNQGAKVIAREVEKIQKQAEITVNEAQVEYQTKIQDVQHDTSMEEAAKRQFAEAAKHDLDQKREQIQDDFQKNLSTAVANKSKEVIKSSTETLLKKAEDKKKNTVEDDIRARLRGFARTIPSFLMAYGTPDTTLANFDTTISDEVFQEVTGITLTQFRKLRDDFQFFDSIVFDESCLEFLRKRIELANYFNDTHDEDIFDYIPPQKTNQIYTPKKVVKMMVDKLEEETPGLFEQSDKTFVDLYIKSGLYLTEIVKRLFDGLAEQIPDEHERIKHILEHQIYGFAPSEIIYNIVRNFIFGFDASANDIDDSHVVCLDTTPYAMGDGNFEAKCDELFGKETR